MSLNLLCGYGSDQDSNEEEQEVLSKAHYGVNVSESQSPQKSAFFQDEANSEQSSSDEDEDAQEEHEEVVTSQTIKPVRRLPSAASVLRSKTLVSSVFFSEQQKEETHHNAKLSQHVQLTEQQKKEARKQVCKAFRRGNCKRGDKCKYFHPRNQETDSAVSSTTSKAKMYTSTEEMAAKRPRMK